MPAKGPLDRDVKDVASRRQRVGEIDQAHVARQLLGRHKNGAMAAQPVEQLLVALNGGRSGLDRGDDGRDILRGDDARIQPQQRRP